MEAKAEKLKTVLGKFWKVLHLKLDGKTPMELLKGIKSRLNLHKSFDYSPEFGICRQNEMLIKPSREI